MITFDRQRRDAETRRTVATRRTKSGETELERLTREQNEDRRRPFTTSTVAPPDVGAADAKVGETAHRDAPTRGRKGKVRKGTERLIFRNSTGDQGPILHVSGYVTERGEHDLSGQLRGPPADLAEAVVRVVQGAKLALMSHREVPTDHLNGVPDPRGPSVVALGGGAFQFVGGGQALPETMLDKVRHFGFDVPAWLTGELLDVLLRIVSFDSGSRGQLSAKALVRLLRDPPELRRHLLDRAPLKRRRKQTAFDAAQASADDKATVSAARDLAKSLPKKPRSKRGKRA